MRALRGKQMGNYKDFLIGIGRKNRSSFNYVSLFSGGGIGDFGLMLAGGRCLAACEIDPNRRAVHAKNIGSPIWGNLRTDKYDIIKSLENKKVHLLIATPPCQSFSSANSRRGLLEDPEHATRDDRNHLFFEVLEVARALKPKVVFFENVPNFLKRKIKSNDGKVTGRVEDFIRASLSDYKGWCDSLCLSEFGIPQRRKRAIAIFIRNDLAGESISKIAPPFNWPGKPLFVPKNILEALNDLPKLDGKSESLASSAEDPLHQVPTYSKTHYEWISSIPENSGLSAWENSCQECGDATTPFFSVICQKCGSEMYNRPHVFDKDLQSIRPIKGFKTSYKRMQADQLAPTVTTASGHFSSDLKLHPNQNRVLSIRECALLQTIPLSFEWPKAQQYKKGYLIREMIGEAVPPLVTYRLGLAIKKALRKKKA